jgi:uncharacterized membrane protein YbhN (UPF0104 family)
MAANRSGQAARGELADRAPPPVGGVPAASARPRAATAGGRFAHGRQGAAPGGAADRTRCAVRGAFLASFASPAGDVLFDLVSLDEMFLAFGYQPSFGPPTVAYAAPDIAGAIPITRGGLGWPK